jgi:cob(I)alamin adenosyltransferase
MRIYTRTGDAGTTGLYRGGRVSKSDPRIAAYGAIDELNAQLGVCRAGGAPAEIDAALARLQHELFALGAELCSPASSPGLDLLDEPQVTFLEQTIDRFEAELTPLKTFILPGGSPASAALHVARVTCRRAEREVVALMASAEVRPAILKYLNRMSDLLFVLARYANHATGVPDVPWEKNL